MASDLMLACHDLSAGYGAVHVLRSVSIGVSAAEVVGVVGPNGSGKSTLLKSVMGLADIYSGSVLWQDRDITRLPTHVRARAGLGLVPQTDNIFPRLTVQENLELGAAVLPKGTLRTEIDQAYEMFPILAERRGSAARVLSGGERRVLSIASALIMQCKCLLLDEPSSDLAPRMIDLVFAKIAEIVATYRIPVLIVEQNVPRMLDIANRLYVLVRGEVRLESRAADTDEHQLGNLFMEVVSEGT